MTNIPFYYNFQYFHNRKIIGYGDVSSIDTAEKFYVFALADKKKPKVFVFDNDEESLQALANLMRVEDVLAVVYGKDVNFSHISEVSFNVDQIVLADRKPIRINDDHGT